AKYVGILLGNGDGTFRKGASVPLVGMLLASADVNGDNRVDLLSDSEIATGNGDGTFQLPQAFGYGQRSIGSDTLLLLELQQFPPLVTADFDRDGILDLVMPSRLTVTFSGGGYMSSGLSMLSHRGPAPSHSVIAVSATNGVRVVAPGS